MPALAGSKGGETTIRQQMEWLHKTKKVNFTFDASLPVDRAYRGPSLKGLPLDKALSTLFEGTGISYKVSGKYVILSKPPTRHKDAPRPAKAVPPAARHTLSGYVRDTGGETLINVTVWDETSGLGTTTNAYGFYSLTLPEGDHLVKYSYLGYGEKKLKARLQANLRQDVVLDEDNRLPDVLVVGDLNSPLLSTQTGRRSFSQSDIKTGYALLSSPDVVKTLQRVSGVAEGVELASGLYVHGGNNDENLFLLDGTPLYQINHTMGLFSSFNADVVKNVDFYKSGFPHATADDCRASLTCAPTTATCNRCMVPCASACSTAASSSKAPCRKARPVSILPCAVRGSTSSRGPSSPSSTITPSPKTTR